MSEQTSPQTRHDLELHIVAKAWKDEAFKQELLSNSKAVYEREIGQKLPENFKIQVMEETSDTLYLSLPIRPQNSQELSDEALEAVAGGGILGSIAGGIVGDKVGDIVGKAINKNDTGVGSTIGSTIGSIAGGFLPGP